MANFDSNGNYNKTNWKTGDKITSNKLNKIEESLEIINNNDIERHKEADERLDALEEQKEVIEERFDALEEQKEVIEERFDELEDLVNQGKADMKAQVAEVEADLEGLHAKDDELSEQLAYIENTKVNYFITPEMFGAVGDGVTDDTQALQDMINFAKNNQHSVMKSQKLRTYLITEGLSLGAHQKFDFSGATIKAGCSMDYVIKVDTSNKNWGCMENLSIDCDGLAKQGILTEWTSMYRFKGIKITNPVEYGIYAKKGNAMYNHILLENLIEDNTPIGLCLNGTDSKVDSMHIKNFKIGILNNGGINFFSNVHAWIVIPKLIPGSIAFSIKGSAVLSNCYADTYYIAVRNDNEQLLTINGLHVFANPDFITKENLNDKEPYVFYLTQDINNNDAYANSIRKTRITGLSCDMSLSGFTNKAKFSNIDGQTFSEKINNYSITTSNNLSSTMFDNLPTSSSTSEFILKGDNYNINTNKLVKVGNSIVADLILSIKDKSLITPETQFTLATIPAGYYPSHTFYTIATFGTDGGGQCCMCPLQVLSSSSSGQRQLKITIPNIFDDNTNANRLRVHINYNL